MDDLDRSLDTGADHAPESPTLSAETGGDGGDDLDRVDPSVDADAPDPATDSPGDGTDDGDDEADDLPTDPAEVRKLLRELKDRADQGETERAEHERALARQEYEARDAARVNGLRQAVDGHMRKAYAQVANANMTEAAKLAYVTREASRINNWSVDKLNDLRLAERDEFGEIYREASTPDYVSQLLSKHKLPVAAAETLRDFPLEQMDKVAGILARQVAEKRRTDRQRKARDAARRSGPGTASAAPLALPSDPDARALNALRQAPRLVHPAR